jgi:hypothetical protein
MRLLSKARVGVKKADIWVGTKIFKSKVGFINNVTSAGKIVQNADPQLSEQNPELYHLIKNGFTPFNNSYDKSLILKLQEKFNALMIDDKYSYPYAGYNDKIYKREMINPAVNFPELSSLITEDVIKIVEGYYTNGCFTIKHIGCGKNYHVPEKIRKDHEMFSNFWHFDFNETSEMKYFVYMSDVTEKDGPFHAQTKSRTQELIKMGFDNRTNYGLPLDVLEDPKHVQKMKGPVGTSFFGHPAVIVHRAGDPFEGHVRNLVQFEFAPAKEKLPKDWIKNVIPHEMHRYDPITDKILN